MNLYRITQILWLVVSNIFYCSIIYGLSSFPLTNSYFSRWLLHHQPVMIFPKITPVMVHDQLRMSLISPIKLSSSLGDMFGPSRWIEHAGYLEKMRIRHDIQKIIASYMINNKPILKVFPELLCIMGIHSLILFPPYLKVFIGFPKTNPPLMSATLSFPADRGFALRPWNQAGLSWDRGMVGYCHGAMLGNLSVSAMGIHHCFCWDLLINYGIYHVYYG